MGRHRTRRLLHNKFNLVYTMLHSKHSLFVPLPDDYNQLLSYRLLSPSERLVLLDLWGHMRNLEFKHQDTTQEPFQYTYSHCNTDCCKDTFHKAMRFVRYLGWIKLADEQVADFQGSRYLRAEAWRTMTWETLERLGGEGKIPRPHYHELDKRHRQFEAFAQVKAESIGRSRGDIEQYRRRLAGAGR